MKIKRGDIYYIELYLEPGKISDHNKRSNGTLSFTGVELMDAIVSAGMPDIYLNKANKRNRKEEIYFKIKLFETYVALSPNGELFSCFHFWWQRNRKESRASRFVMKRASVWYWTDRWCCMRMANIVEMLHGLNSGVWRRSCGCCMNKRYYESTVEYKSQKCYNAVKYAKQ